MFFDLATTILFVILMITIMFFIIPIHLKPRDIMVLWYVFIVALAVFAFYAEPSFSDDLSDHYRNIRYFREGTINIFYSPLVLWNTLLWLVSLTKYDGLLPFASVLIWGIFIGKTLTLYLQRHAYKTRTMLIYFVAALGSCSVFYIISGVRNAMVVAIWVYAYYFWYEQNRKKYYMLCLAVVAIHVIALLLIILCWLYEYIVRKGKQMSFAKMLIPVFVIGLLLNSTFLEALMRFLPSAYFSLVSSKFSSYKEEYSFNERWILENQIKLLVLFVIFVCELYLYFKKKKKMEYNLFLILCTIALSSMPIFFERMIYIISVLSFSSLNETLNEWKPWQRTFLSCVIMAIFAGQLFFSFYAMFSHISFNGTLYRETMRQIFWMDKWA